MNERHVYLKARPWREALAVWMNRIESVGGGAPLPGEDVPLAGAAGRISSGAVTARISSPFYHSAAMDGYAVRFADTFGASETTPRSLAIGAGALQVDTGDPLPEGMNAVLMIEDINLTAGGRSIEFHVALTPWENVRVVGEDIVAGELIIPEGHRIRPVDVGAMLAGGHVSVAVRRRPRVAIIPTGTEIVEPGAELGRGDIIDYNSYMLVGMVAEWGGEPVRMGIVPDDRERLASALAEAASRADLVAVIAGSSAGREDHTASVIAGLGEVVAHGIRTRPGKPAILGLACGVPVIGVPGYPVSAHLVFTLFVRPLIARRLGVAEEGGETIRAVMSRQAASKIGVEEFLRMKVGRVGGRLIATPLGRGAGLMMSLVRADGFLLIPEMSEGLGAGAEVEIELIRKKDEIENTVVVIGSHDNALDLLANAFKKRHPRYAISSANVGSMGGLMAIKKGEAHVAPMHLLDEETGEYNVPFIKRLVPDRRLVLVNLVYREQGLMVLPGNPKGIAGLKDLARPDVMFINRQRGAGTRLLLDKYLRELGIAPEGVQGYQKEEYTHMAVASAVLSGVADAGLGVLSAANAMGLGFIPVARERYDLLIPEEHLELPMVAAVLEVIRDDEGFRAAVVALGGYGAEDMGKVMWRG